MAGFKIQDDGTFVSENQDLYTEYNRLVYEVIGPQNRFTPIEKEMKRQRMKEIERTLKNAQSRLQAKIENDNRMMLSGVDRFRREND